MTHLSTLVLALLALPMAQAEEAPVLLDFHADWCAPCRQMRPAVASLTREGYPVKSIDIDKNSELAARYKVDGVPAFVVVDRQGRELDRLSGLRPASELATMYNEAQARLKETRATVPDTSENFRTRAQNVSLDDEDDLEKDARSRRPRPWETVVRIKIFNQRSVGFGSGTVVYSTPEETIILTCAHIFKIDGMRQQPHPKKFPLKIQVDLFDGILHGMRPAQVHPVESVRGEAIDYDFAADLGLIRIRPGRVLPASPVVPPTWKPTANQPMITVGCSEGNDATAWSTHITNPEFRGQIGESKNYTAIECNHAPLQGRSGGGLYTTEGYLAGVCDFAAPQDRRGLYAHPKSIYQMLNRNRAGDGISLAVCYDPSLASPDVQVAARDNRAPRRTSDAPQVTLRGQDSTLPGSIPIPAMPEPEGLGIALKPYDAETAPAAEQVRDTAGGNAWQAPPRRQGAGGDGASLLAGTERPPSARPVSLAGADSRPAPLLMDNGDEARTVDMQMDPNVAGRPLPETRINLEDVAPLPRSREAEVPSGGWRAVRRPTISTGDR